MYELVTSIYDNPVTRGIVSGLMKASSTVMKPSNVQQSEIFLWRLVEKNNMYIKLAGLFGASAVILGAYGAHAFHRNVKSEELKIAFETANRYHFLHTFPLLTLPLFKRPHLVGGLLISGMTIFCGSCYVYAFTGDQTARKCTPYGGTLLILAWLSMMF